MKNKDIEEEEDWIIVQVVKELFSLFFKLVMILLVLSFLLFSVETR